ncbi:MAG: hypothetical protein K0S32_3162 [Bacteroidetes bacterium]|nr:hypothetical protein [Bacteroidota bacterium]
MRNILTLILFFALTPIHSQTWTQVPDFPSAGRDDGAAFVIGNKAYCMTGRDPSGCQLSGYQFDGATETWSTMASLPAGNERQYSTPFSYNGKGYLLAGVTCSNTYIKQLWQYDPAVNTWSLMPDFAGSGRHGSHNFVIGDKVYVVGGWDDVNYLNEVWEYNLTSGVWTQKNNLPLSGFWRGAAFAISGTGYIAFGFTNSNYYNHKIYQYNQAGDSWSVVPGITLGPRKYIGTAVINNKAFFCGGQDSIGDFLSDALVFDPATNTVVAQSGIPAVARRGGMAFALNNIFYYTCGLQQDGQRNKETWKTDGVVGITSHEFQISDFRFYPNPVSDVLTFSGEQSLEATEIFVTNSLGQKITTEISIHQNEARINTKDLSGGIYFLSIRKDGQMLSKRFIILH